MSSVAIVGKPGSSKSYRAMVLLVQELLVSDRKIVSNLPVRLDNLIKHLVRIGRGDIDVYGRVQLLEYDQVAEFWRYRGPGVEPLSSISKDECKQGVRPNFEAFGTQGVVYFLDELHEHLNSRQWASTGEIVLWYIAKHRHFGDDVFWMSQSPANVDKQWRSVTQEYWECRNYSKERFRGFNKGRYCEAKQYLEMPTGTQTCQNTEEYKIDPKGIGSCYYTSLAKGKADTESKVRGVNIKWLYAGIIGIAVLVALAFHYVPMYFAEKAKIKGADAMAKLTRDMQIHQHPGQSSSSTSPSSRPGQAAPSPSPVDRPVNIVAVPLNDVPADQVVSALHGGVPGDGQSSGSAGGSDRGIVAIPNAANDAVLLTGENLQAVMAYAQTVRGYDKPQKLITVNAVVGRLVRGRSSKIGLNDLLITAASSQATSSLSPLLASVAYDVTTGIATFGTALAARQVLEVITDFQARNYSFEVVNRPTISVLSGNSGVFGTGQEIPLPQTVSDVAGTRTSVQYKSAEFAFTVTPTLMPDGRIRLLIDQKNSDVLSSAQIGGSTVPTLSTQSLKTMIDLLPSQIAYLGGIHVRTKNTERRGVPVLKDIPVINLVFGTHESSNEDSDLVILVSVEVNSSAPVRVRRALPVSDHSNIQSWNDDTSTLSPQATVEQDNDPVNKGRKTER